MKLQTSIPPRRDGTVKVTGLDGQTYTLSMGEDGELVGDVADEATVAHLLDGGLFFPADPADFDAALQLTKGQDSDGDGGEGEGEDGQDGEVDDDDADEGSMDALPLEAETPPAAAPGRKARKAK